MIEVIAHWIASIGRIRPLVELLMIKRLVH
jgi:hypothetical protein